MNKKVEYEPVQIYNRKMLRGMLRAAVIEKNGYHNVNKAMSNAFKNLRGNK